MAMDDAIQYLYTLNFSLQLHIGTLTIGTLTGGGGHENTKKKSKTKILSLGRRLGICLVFLANLGPQKGVCPKNFEKTPF